ncbi:RES family NAD+ phosphorylase [Imbroritus primus]|uniref:RES family NAD+ phosphorylase n=1 Tax=Imbroritus primus TaxID=3058603 RepID=UPI003D16194E
MIVHRLAKERAGRYQADDLSGQGAALAGGRWNPRGMAVLYTCEHVSTAVLEARVHMAGLLPVRNLFLVTLEVPDADVEAAVSPPLPEGWDALDHDPAETVALGRQWLSDGTRLVMRVPSVVCPQEFNLLLNPAHPHMRRVKVMDKQPFAMDYRLFR